MVDLNLALVVGAVVVLVALVSIAWGYAFTERGSRGASDLALRQRQLDEAQALAAHRAELLEQAKQLLADAEADGRAAIERRRDLDAALRDAPAGGRLDAVERVLRDRAAARAARRAAEAGAAAAGPPPSGPRAADPPRVDGAHA